MLKSFITDNLLNCKVVISTLTLRTDDGKAALKGSQLTNHLLQLDIEIIDNRNINARNLGNKCLHLNPTGTSRLAKNLLSSIKSFWKAKGCLGIINEKNIEPEHSLVLDLNAHLNKLECGPTWKIKFKSLDQYKEWKTEATYYWATKHQF